MKQILYLLIVALTVTACRHIENEDVPSDCDLKLLFSVASPSNVESSRLDAATSWVTFGAGDRIGLQAVEWSGETTATQAPAAMKSSGNHTDNHPFELLSGGSWSGAPLTSPSTWRKFAVYAYYPFSTPAVDLLKMKIEPRGDQSAGVVSEDFFLRGVGASDVTLRDGAPLRIAFTHVLTYLKVVIDLPAMYGGKLTDGITGVTVVGTPRLALLNMESGVMTASDDNGAVKMSLNGGVYEGVVMPCFVQAGDSLLKVDFVYKDGTADFFYSYAILDGVDLAPNTVHTISLSAPELSFASELYFDTSAKATAPVNIVTNMAERWSIVSSVDWLTVADAVDQTGEKAVQVTAAKNDTGQPRIGKLTLTNGILSRDMAVRQN